MTVASTSRMTVNAREVEITVLGTTAILVRTHCMCCQRWVIYVSEVSRSAAALKACTLVLLSNIDIYVLCG